MSSYHPFQTQDQPTNFISSELKNHPTWSPVVAELLTSSPRQWREAALPEPKGICLTIFREDTESYIAAPIFVLTPDDLPSFRLPPVTINPGAIVFLLDSSASENPADSLRSFMNLQMQLATSPAPIPILPLTTASALRETLHTFASSLLRSSQQYLPVIEVLTDLVPYCHLRPSGARLSRPTVETITEEGGSLRETIRRVVRMGVSERELRERENSELRSWRLFWEAEIECD
ncbi:hypothetical protein QBC44DRAFT_385562 [Cladorrhinum sp. PSN332]|nr:hypothetical protein QBC44DRAFT_385562 [Cladorrhinum sp. PSN332]